MNELDAFLIEAICMMTDPINALMGVYTDPGDELIANRMLNILGLTHFSESAIDDLLELADDNAPITLRANRKVNYPALNSTTLPIPCPVHGSDFAIVDYCLN